MNSLPSKLRHYVTVCHIISGGTTPGRARSNDHQMTWLENPPTWLRPAYWFALLR